MTLTGTLTRISTDANNTQSNEGSWYGHFSADNRYVVFKSKASNLVSGDTNGVYDVYLKDLETGAITRVTHAFDGSEPNEKCSVPVISADGRYIAFEADATNLVADDTNGVRDVFVWEMATDTITRVSTKSNGAQANGISRESDISSDGQFLVFISRATNLVPQDTNNQADIFLKDLLTGTVTRISTYTNGGQIAADHANPDISENDRYVVYTSGNLIRLKDLNNGIDKVVSCAADGTIAAGGACERANISADGRYVVFHGSATNLVEDDTNGVSDVFRKDMITGDIVRVSTAADGTEAHGASANATLSADGRYVVFESAADNLVTGVSNGQMNIFMKDVDTGEIVCLSTDSTGNAGNLNSWSPFISSDGQSVVFESYSTNLIAGDTNDYADLFLWTRTPTNDTVDPYSGDDIISGTSGADTISGSTGNDSIRGLKGADSLLGGVGNDTLFGDDQDDTLFGGSGRDSLLGGGDDDTVHGGTQNDTLLGNAGDDSLLGESGNDVVNGGQGNDVLRGNSGADRLTGGDGDDTLVGGTSDDLLTGGSGADRFVFGTAEATDSSVDTDTITDYNPDEHDVIDLKAGVSVASISVVGDHVVITLTGNDKIIVEGITNPNDVLIV